MTILLTGGAGYIASHTAVLLCEAGNDVVLLDNLCNSSKDVVRRIESITGRKVIFVEADVRNVDAVKRAIVEHSVDAVMHFAGLKAVGESVQLPIDYYSNNVHGTISLLRAMQECDLRTLVFSSSATVYGNPMYLPIDELHPTSATNPYGRSKLHVEEMLQDVARSSEDWHIVCLRYFNPVGAHPSGKIGENPKGIPNNLMPYISQVASGIRSHLSVFGDNYDTPDGTGMRDYVHVIDLAEGHIAALRYVQRNVGWHIFNLGTGCGTSVLQMIKAFSHSSGVSVPYRVIERRPGDVASCYASTENARKLLGWEAKRGIEEMCASAWRWQRNIG